MVWGLGLRIFGRSPGLTCRLASRCQICKKHIEYQDHTLTPRPELPTVWMGLGALFRALRAEGTDRRNPPRTAPPPPPAQKKKKSHLQKKKALVFVRASAQKISELMSSALLSQGLEHRPLRAHRLPRPPDGRVRALQGQKGEGGWLGVRG